MRLVELFGAVVLIGLLAPRAANSQNLVTNPEFTSNSADWFSFGGGTVGWTGMDGTPTPGALDFTHAGACDCEQFATQCVAVAPNATYEFHYATKRMVASSPTYATLYARVVWSNLPNCAATIMSIAGDGISLDELPVGVWQQRGDGIFVTPSTAVSVRVLLGAAYTGATPILLRFDDVYLGPAPELVFADGFED